MFQPLVAMKIDVSGISNAPAKFNMEPENKPLEKEKPFGHPDVEVTC